LFTWLRDHEALYASSADRRHGVDLEEVCFRFGLKNGQTVVIESRLAFNGDDLWALSTIADGIVLRAMTLTRILSMNPKLPPNRCVDPPVRPVTSLACASAVPGRPAGHARR
jgi:hypothetical protein